MRTYYLLLFLLLSLLFFLQRLSVIKETLTSANPVGTCQTNDGSFGTQTQFTLDDGSSTTICQANNLSSTTSSSDSSSTPSDPSTPVIPTPDIPTPSTDPSIPVVSSSTPIIPQPTTTCAPLSSDFDSLCRQQFGPDYGYQLLSSCEDTTQQKAFCSHAYQGGLPLYENNSTDCVPFSWSSPITANDPRKDDIARYCLPYSFSTPLKNISSQGCSAPDQARAICS